MKKFIIFVFIMFLSLPVFAQNDDKVMKSELGRVQSVQNEDVEQNYSDKSQVKQVVTVKLLTGEFKGQEFKTINMITNNPFPQVGEFGIGYAKDITTYIFDNYDYEKSIVNPKFKNAFEIAILKKKK